MVRRPRHPALRQSLKQREQAARDDVIESTEWQFLPKLDKVFLYQYLIHGDYKKAQELTGVTHDWLAERETDSKFLKILNRAMAVPTQIATNMAMEVTPESVQIMIDIMRNGKGEHARLKAAESIQRIAGLGVEDETGKIQNNQFNIQVTHWNSGLAAMQPVEADGTIIEGN